MFDFASIRPIIILLFKYKKSIIGVFLVTIMVVVFGTYQQEKEYTAFSNLFAKFGRQYVYNPAIGEARNPTNYFNRDGIIDTELEILKSRDLRLQVIRDLGIVNIYPDLIEEKKQGVRYLLDVVKERLRKHVGYLGAKEVEQGELDSNRVNIAEQIFLENMNVIGNPKSNIIRITFTHSDPNIAAEAVNLLVDFYQESRLRVFSDPLIPEFLENKVRYYEQEREEFLDVITGLRRENNVYSYADQQGLLIKQRAELSFYIEDSHGQILALQDKVDFLEKQMEQVSNSNPLNRNDRRRNQAVENAKKELLDLQLKEQELLARYKSSSQQVVSVRRAIKTVNQYLRAQKTEEGVVATSFGAVGDVAENIKLEIIMAMVDLRSLKVKSQSAVKQLEKIDEELRVLTIKNRDLERYISELHAVEKQYKINMDKLEQTKVLQEMDQNMLTNIRVVQRAVVPVNPVSPDMKMNVMVGSVLGFFAGIALALLRELNGQFVNSISAAEKKFELPVLVSIPYKKSTFKKTYLP